MTTTYIFYLHDERGNKTAKFTFNDTNHKKVIAYLENNIDDYFDGNPQRQKDNLNRIIQMVKEGVTIHEAINVSNDIYATCEEIQSIQNIQY